MSREYISYGPRQGAIAGQLSEENIEPLQLPPPAIPLPHLVVSLQVYNGGPQLDFVSRRRDCISKTLLNNVPKADSDAGSVARGPQGEILS